MRIFAVAMNTYREAIRDKVLYVLLFLAGTTILGSKALGWTSVGQDEKIIVDISLAALTIFGTFIAIFVGTNLVYKEIDKRTIYTILSQPLERYEFILGKYCGLAMLLAVVTLAMTAMATSYIVLLGGVAGIPFFQAIFLIYVQLLLLTALSVLLSSLTSPILGAFIVFACYILGHASGILVDLPPQFDDTALKEMMRVLHFIVPNLSNLDIRSEVANGVVIRTPYILWSAAYGAAYTAMLLVLAALAFQNKDV